MTTIEVKKEVLARLKGKTVIITGGANGIGKTTVCLLHEYGANVVIGDLDTENGEALLESIDRAGVFQKTDVTDWSSLRALFKTASNKYGTIDAVFANAGVPEKEPDFFEDLLNDNGDLAEPDLRLIDVNLNGVLRTAKLALYHFAKNRIPGGALVITGSAASYFASAPIVRYGAAKHALVGLMRCIASMTATTNTRVNLVAPWMTETDFSSEVKTIWGDLPMNTRKEVAETLLLAAADEDLNGRGLYVAKGVVDFELPLYKTKENWMTSGQANLFEMGRRRLADGMGLPGDHYLEEALQQEISTVRVRG